MTVVAVALLVVATTCPAAAKAGPAAGAAGSSSPLLGAVDAGLKAGQDLDAGAHVAAVADVDLALAAPRSWTYLDDLARFAEDAKWRLEVDGCPEPSVRLKTRVRGYQQFRGGNKAGELSLSPYAARVCGPSRTTSHTRGLLITTDPLGYVDGPNLYQFALNNPVNFSDPMGLATRVNLFGKSFVLELPQAVEDVVNFYYDAVGYATRQNLKMHAHAQNGGSPKVDLLSHAWYTSMQMSEIAWRINERLLRGDLEGFWYERDAGIAEANALLYQELQRTPIFNCVDAYYTASPGEMAYRCSEDAWFVAMGAGAASSPRATWSAPRVNLNGPRAIEFRQLAATPENPAAYSGLWEMMLDSADLGRGRGVHFNRANAALEQAERRHDNRWCIVHEDRRGFPWFVKKVSASFASTYSM